MKKILQILLGVIAAIVVVSFFLPSTFTMQRTGIVSAPKDVVYEQVNTLKNWEKWSPWHSLDPQMKLSYSGPTSGVGSKYSWESTNPNVGVGSATITQATIGDSLRLALDFGPNGTASTTYAFERTDNNQTKVTLTFSSPTDTPPIIGKYFGVFFLEKLLAKDFEKGLSNLDSLAKTSLPKQVAPLMFNIKQTK